MKDFIFGYCSYLLMRQELQEIREVDIYFPNEQNKTIKVREQQLFQLKKMKKKILQTYRFQGSQTSHIQLNIMEMYPGQPQQIPIPAFHQYSFKHMIGFLLMNDRRVKLSTIILDNHILKKKPVFKKNKVESYFDQNGSVMSDQEETFAKNFGCIIPEHPPKYNGDEIVRCQFCSGSSKDTNKLTKCGGIYGPFENGKYSHLLCAIWCYDVFFQNNEDMTEEEVSNRNGRLMNVPEAMKEAKKKICKYCQKNGAGLTCFNKMHNPAHYLCAQENGWKFNWLNYKMLCKKCRPNKKCRQRIEVEQVSVANQSDYDDEVFEIQNPQRNQSEVIEDDEGETKKMEQ